jgi:hypothetical protein
MPTALRQTETLDCQLSSINWDKRATAMATLDVLEPNAALLRLVVQDYVEALAFVNLLSSVVRQPTVALLSRWNDSLRAHSIS